MTNRSIVKNKISSDKRNSSDYYNFKSLNDFKNTVTEGTIVKFGRKNKLEDYVVVKAQTNALLLGRVWNNHSHFSKAVFATHKKKARILQQKFLVTRLEYGKASDITISGNRLKFNNGVTLIAIKPKPRWVIQVIFPKSKKDTFFSSHTYMFKKCGETHIKGDKGHTKEIPKPFEKVLVRNKNKKLRTAIVVGVKKVTEPMEVCNSFYAEPVVEYQREIISDKAKAKLIKHLKKSTNMEKEFDDFLGQVPKVSPLHNKTFNNNQDGKFNQNNNSKKSFNKGGSKKPFIKARN